MAQIFERFNVVPFSILDWPMARLYAVGMLSSLVIDGGKSRMDIALMLIYDSLQIQTYSCPNLCHSLAFHHFQQLYTPMFSLTRTQRRPDNGSPLLKTSITLLLAVITYTWYYLALGDC
jgi:hypothetical protein